GELVTSLEAAIAAAARIGYPVVLKPLDGNHGRGVCLDLRDEAGVRASFETAASESRDGRVVVERYVVGKDYRILVVDKRVVAVAERVPAHVVGDGVLTVGELVEIANADPRRGIGHEKVLTRIPLNERTLQTLDRQGLALDSVPGAGQHVRLQETGNMSTGGTSIDRTDDIHPDNVEIARQAAMIIGLDVAGVDMIAPISPALYARRVAELSRSTPVPASACTPTLPKGTHAAWGGRSWTCSFQTAARPASRSSPSLEPTVRPLPPA
ncbi:MAG: cyanophycin synthetase, partial [Thermomicrobiales bacterium]|nr:cyanophycin synthetase [Thermomicrobiales bacterium]